MKQREESSLRDDFLGTDRRSIEEITRADNDTVKNLGLTHQTIAGRMSFFRDQGKYGLGSLVKTEPHFEVSCEMARGFLPCPFGEPGTHRKTTVTVRNLLLNMEITFSDLNIHLIEKHGFYEGRGSPFRLEPDVLTKVLEIVA